MRIAVIGAGIVGLAVARAAAQKGHEVQVFERHAKAQGASIRNFGLYWPLGQQQVNFRSALRSGEIWKEFFLDTHTWHQESGALLPAYEADEWQVLQEYYGSRKNDAGYRLQLLAPEGAIAISPLLNRAGLKGALYSQTEMVLDPRMALEKLPNWLTAKYGVAFHWSNPVIKVDSQYLETANGEAFAPDQIYICSGADFEWLYPRQHLESGIQRCKLLMLSTEPIEQPLGPPVIGPLSLAHYEPFANCPSYQMLKQRLQLQYAEYFKRGIHVMAAQHADGRLIIGDSHNYASEHGPFSEQATYRLILDYLEQFLTVPNLQIAETWQGVYAKIPNKSHLVLHPEPKVTIVNALGGGGMTLSFALAEKIVN
ncbi:MAG: TIGR03364 family FAD-dependent oxidoreductase [Chitinophagales bacterium]|nr:TIGR03364 family FAD-dependent oxidoreductase [Chitinophagales bacterium]